MLLYLSVSWHYKIIFSYCNLKLHAICNIIQIDNFFMVVCKYIDNDIIDRLIQIELILNGYPFINM